MGRVLRAVLAVLFAGLVVAPVSLAVATARRARAPAAHALAPVTRAGAPTPPAHDTPRGFWYGTDSNYPTASGPAPYREPVIGGSYGGYMGMVGGWDRWLHCTHFLVWSASDAVAADTNHLRYRRGVGTGAYWFMGGPGVDPRYNGTAAEARAWGARQAARALADIHALPASERIVYPVVWMDIERPKIAPARDNGWTSVYTSPCSGVVKRHFIPARVNRAEFDGFAGYLRAHSSYRPGVYSDPGDWRAIFGRGRAGRIKRTYEWTYEDETADLTHAPAGWCYRGIAGCARFFGGLHRTSRYALMWQFSGGGGVGNGYGDFDQIDGRVVK